jgi:dTDP-4-dehydrorhamnose 3,5-epimerase
MIKKYFEHKPVPGLTEVFEITPSVFSDERGLIYTDYLEDYMESEFGLSFKHSKIVINEAGVLRGFHGDNKTWKLVTCLYGKVHQVVVNPNARENNLMPKFSVNLDFRQPKMILIPPGYGNAFLSLKGMSVYSYKLAYSGNYNDAESQFTIPWNSLEISHEWPINNPILSKRDAENN